MFFPPLFTHNTKINLRMPMHAFIYTVLLTLSIWSSFENSWSLVKFRAWTEEEGHISHLKKGMEVQIINTGCPFEFWNFPPLLVPPGINSGKPSFLDLYLRWTERQWDLENNNFKSFIKSFLLGRKFFSELFFHFTWQWYFSLIPADSDCVGHCSKWYLEYV